MRYDHSRDWHEVLILRERNARLVAALKEARQFIHLTYPGCENERRVDAAIAEALAQQSTEKP
jgi:hypothetical protein